MELFAYLFVAFALPFAAGALAGVLIYERALSRGARLVRTGSAEPLVAKDQPARGSSVNTEATALRQISQQSVEVGADRLQAAAKEQGVSLTRKEALHEAALMLGGSDPLGGAR